MAILSLSEYDIAADDQNHSILPTGDDPETAYQELAIGASSVQSVAFQSTTTFIRVHVDVPCRIQINATPTAAVGTSKRMAGNTTEYIGVAPGQKLAVITSA